MAANEIRKDDSGTIFEREIKDGDSVVDVSGAVGANTKEIIFKKPDGTIVTKSAAFSGSGTNGKIQYVAETGFLDQLGIWKWQGHIVLAAGDWKTDILEFKVSENL